MAEKRWKCVCGYLMTEQETIDNTVCIDYGDRWTPPENDSFCTQCGKGADFHDEVWVCSDHCDNEVEKGYDNCYSCLADGQSSGAIDWAEYQQEER